MHEKICSLVPELEPSLLHIYDQLPSTNDLAKTMARQGAPHGTVIIAQRQTGGRGRMGRSFHSPAGMGIYLSTILRPQCEPGQLMHLTCATAVAMCDAVDTATGLRPGIKWINDLVWQTRKLGGILTELVLKPNGQLEAAVVGIGINCGQSPADFPDALADIACSLKMATGSSPDLALLAATMIRSLLRMSGSLLSGQAQMLDRYKADCVTLGQDILVVRAKHRIPAKALAIDTQGALVIRTWDGEIQTVNSGEVSVRGMYGYA